MRKQFLLVFVLGSAMLSSSSPAVNLFIDSQTKAVDVRCPVKAQGHRLDTQVGRSKDVLSSIVEVTFNCQLYYDVYQTVPAGEKYHVSMIPLFNLSIVGCPKLDGCLWLYLRHVPPRAFVEVNIKSHVTCLYQTLPFKYELRQLSSLIGYGYVDVHVGQKPPKPGYFKFRDDNGKLFLEGFVNSLCNSDMILTRYFMTYELTAPNCSLSNESLCHLQKGKKSFLVVCAIPSGCHQSSACDTHLSAYMYGVNKFQMVGDRSSRFSNILALANPESLSVSISNVSLSSLIVLFKKPVNCTSTFSSFQYKISYSEINLEDQEIYILEKSCRNLLTCNVHIVGLKPGTHYKVCVQYHSHFDYASSYSLPYCVNATTGQVPCKTPEIFNVTHVTSHDKFWDAVVSWKPLDPECWHDSKKQYYVMNLQRPNSSSVMIGEFPSNETSQVISSLAYTELYTLVILACNSYGCIPGISYRLEVVYNERKEQTSASSTQRIAETILICVLSLLFLFVSSILYTILRKRKQLSRFQRTVRRQDIHLVAQPQIVHQQPDEKEKSDAPLLKQTIVHEIPENSTLV